MANNTADTRYLFLVFRYSDIFASVVGSPASRGLKRRATLKPVERRGWACITLRGAHALESVESALAGTPLVAVE